jgi:hypothetical protein
MTNLIGIHPVVPKIKYVDRGKGSLYMLGAKNIY